ncbi:MAG: chromosome segregation protein SMC [Alkalinema sp. CACIAM 70d]|nr:MAG: chromosome segregation protein SMC [Alkalinema sp. CACIAM 70d]
MFVKRLELTNFKSFGGTTQVPVLPGFTVISGPNGSGKSNLLDAILFCLGLAGSKGMRAERLPDLVNQSQSSRGRTVEASVTVTFDLSDDRELLEAIRQEAIESGQEDARFTVQRTETGQMIEWSVTRKLRVTQQGTYTSNYYINNEPCTLTELHDQLNRLRVYPEGYNVVLQGDVTRIISMNPRERREIIDELAGVASFDRKITQAKEKLDAVKDREDKYRIVEKELIDQRDRLSQDRAKAEKYKKLRAELQAKEQWEAVFRFQQSQTQAEKLQAQIVSGEAEIATLTQQIATAEATIKTTGAELDALNAKVRALGEAEQIALQSQLATREAELRQLTRQEQDLQTSDRDLQTTIGKTQQELAEQRDLLNRLTQEQLSTETQELASLTQARNQAQAQLEQSRQAASQSAASAEAWVQEQTNLRHQIDTILQTLDPQRTEQARLRERASQLEKQMEEQTRSRNSFLQQLTERQAEQETLVTALKAATEQVQSLAQSLAAIDQELQIQKDTQTRLQNEQREKQRKLDKLEAQKQAVQEAQGTFATQVILGLGMSGVHGLVAQLGRVESTYQTALEIAAGARLGHLVVDDDAIAAAAIEILKQQRAGRATFLPLNKIRAPQIPDASTLRTLNGCVGYAIDLIDCDDRYWDVFAYVFSGTVVFETINAARRHLGKFRMVTLDGELLEASGAMTGGSIGKSALHFGTGQVGESAEVLALRERLGEIDTILFRCEDAIAKATIAHQNTTKQLIESRQQHRELQLQSEQLTKELDRLNSQQESLEQQIQNQSQEQAAARSRLQELDRSLPDQEAQLATLRQTLETLEQSQTHSEWQQIQAHLRQLETELDQREKALRTVEQRLADIVNQKQRSQERIEQGETRLQELREQQTQVLQQTTGLQTQRVDIQAKITELQAALVELDKTLGEERHKRDALDKQLRELQTQRQQADWQRQKVQESQSTRRQELSALQEQIEQQKLELPDPLPEIPEDATRDVAQLQHEIRSLQKRLQAMEPVNMLALEEYERTQERLQELSDKLATLGEERTELLLRIENFTTLRVRAFREAFDAVNENFQQIFATLSDGDGRLQLEDQQDPFNGGLNLIAHPKGKPVQRLASMSGGEKSLTALSFIFALQRYRPSPFYAFDEVDMFLDGANVEKLARMIKHQAQSAQFIVVSLRRPMIESAQRTIGVTQARGAYTQVLGIQLEGQAQTASG